MSSKIAAALMGLADSLAGTNEALRILERAATGDRRTKSRTGSKSRPLNYYTKKKSRRNMAKQSRRLNRKGV